MPLLADLVDTVLHPGGASPSDHEDCKLATDFVIFSRGPAKCAARTRRPDYRERFSNEITLRSWRRGGVRTELAKILDGEGDFLAYAFADPDPTRVTLGLWVVIDLALFRSWFFTMLAWQPAGRLVGREFSNRDGRSKGLAISLGIVDHNVIVGRGDRWPM